MEHNINNHTYKDMVVITFERLPYVSHRSLCFICTTSFCPYYNPTRGTYYYFNHFTDERTDISVMGTMNNNCKYHYLIIIITLIITIISSSTFFLLPFSWFLSSFYSLFLVYLENIQADSDIKVKEVADILHGIFNAIMEWELKVVILAVMELERNLSNWKA